LLAAKLFAHRHRRTFIERFFGRTDKVVGLLAEFYLAVLRRALRWWFVTLFLAVAFVVLTFKIVPALIGGELMPPMDTGIATIEFATPADYAPAYVEKVLDEVERIIYQEQGVQTVSSVVGSEPGEISFGGGGATAQSAKITVRLIDRLHRDRTIWEIEDRWRTALTRLAGVQSFRVSEYGATPVSTTKAPLDIVISGPDAEVASRLADRCLEALKGMPGLIDVRRGWFLDKPENKVVVDPALARLYRTSPQQIAQELKTYIKGVPASRMRLREFLDIPLTVQYDESYVQDPASLEEAYVSSKFGPLPLRAIATFHTQRRRPYITRERLANTLNVTGVNRIYTIGQVAGMAKKRIGKVPVPEGYKIEVGGTMADMKTGQKEMGGALRIGFVLLYILLLAIFKSFRHPVTIMAAIPLAVAGGLWGLLLFDKPMCKPATVGMVLLGGTIVNNSILLLDFIINTRAKGIPKQEAILQAVRLRIRPILMTTVSTVVGLTPLILALAIGLERMSPLGIVAATGLIVGTFLTIVVIPVLYSVLDSLAQGVGSIWRFVAPRSQPTKP